jgi:hypothetical protein
MIIKERIASIDALRGFDMFWIAGGEGLINSLHTLMPNAVTAALDQQFTHVDWEGFWPHSRRHAFFDKLT